MGELGMNAGAYQQFRHGLTWDSSCLEHSVIAAYLAAVYRFDSEGGRIDMHIGQHRPELAALYAQHGVDCLTFITACNPLGQRVSAHQSPPSRLNAA